MQDSSVPAVGKNDPCPCGSGYKYKRCHGKDAVSPAMPAGGFQIPAELKGQLPEGFDPNSIDPQWMNDFTRALQRLPRNQMVRFQQLMQRAMAGEDVAEEAALLEKLLPPDVQKLMASGPMAAMMEQQATVVSATEEDMSVNDARKIVEEAMASGSLSKEEGAALLAGQEKQSSGGLGKLWSKIKGK